MSFLDTLVGRPPRLEGRAAAAFVGSQGYPLGGAGNRGGQASMSAGRSQGDFTVSDATRDGYRGSATVFRCVNMIAAPLAALDLGLINYDGEGEYDFASPVPQLFNRKPNPNVSAVFYKVVLWTQLELAGQSFSWINRGETGQGDPQELWNIFDPVEVLVQRGLGGSLIGYRVNTAAGTIPLLPAEMLWLRYPDPGDAWGCVAPLRAAAWAADLDAQAREYQAAEFRNGRGPHTVVYLGDTEEGQFKQAVADYDASQGGPRAAGRPMFTAGPVPPVVARVMPTAEEMSMLKSREANAIDMMRAFGISQDLVNGGSTYENQQAAKVNLWTETLFPKLQVIEAEIDRQLLGEQGDVRAEFDSSDVSALQENADAIAKRVMELARWDVTVIDEARDALGLEPMPGGDGKLTVSELRYTIWLRMFGPLLNAGQPQVDANGQPIPGGAGAMGPKLPAPPSPLSAQLSIDTTELEALILAPGEQRALEGQDHPKATAGTSRHPTLKPHLIDPAAVGRHYARLEQVGQRAVGRLAEKQHRVVARNLARVGRKGKRDSTPSDVPAASVTVADVFDPAYWGAYTREALGDFVGQAFDAGATSTASALGLDFGLYDQQVTNAMNARLAVLADQVTETTRKALEEQVLNPGVEAGESVPQLAERLKTVFGDLADSRAKSIALTETVGGFNAASSHIARQSAQTASRTWLTAGDDRVRDSHAALEGYTTQGMGDAYPNGLMFPGDPSGAPEESINCRCVETFNLQGHDVPEDVQARAGAIRVGFAARAAEPAATRLLEGLTSQAGGKMEGLPFRLKTEGRLIEKIIGDAHGAGVPIAEAAAGIGDALRYTSTFEGEQFNAGVATLATALRDQGYRNVKWANTLETGNMYRGINTNWVSPTGATFELQFHTPDSFTLKDGPLHKLYEEARLEGTSPERRQALFAEMRTLSATLEFPAGAADPTLESIFGP